MPNRASTYSIIWFIKFFFKAFGVFLGFCLTLVLIVYISLAGSDVEVFSTRDAAEARKQAYSDGTIQGAGPGDVQFDYGYDLLKIVKRTIG